MDNFIVAESEPPNWPANEREAALEAIYNKVICFIENPNYKNKEILVSLVSSYDLNQIGMRGLHRITEYEVGIINTLYFYAATINLNTLKVFLYEIIGRTARMQKMVPQMLEDSQQSPEIDEYKGLIGCLRLYYAIYLNYVIAKDKSFADKIIEIITGDDLLEERTKKEVVWLTRSYISMLMDISYFRSRKISILWAFSRDDLLKLFGLLGKMLRINNESAGRRPLRGVLNITISNFVLKSRNNYNEDYICKYVSREVAQDSLRNHEIWMQKTQYLNDERELKVLPELFKNDSWLNYDWAKDIDFKIQREYYVSSFSKSIKNDDMSDKYGECIYGYKDDRIAELLAPIFLHKMSERVYPVFSQVVAYDIIYDMEKAKEEINYLCAIIDKFGMADEEKNSFLEEILQYWILAVKDKNWEYERERRYVLFLYKGYEYIDVVKDERFLKVKTSLFFLPDFILGDNPGKISIKESIDNKRRAVYKRDYMFCENCFSCDFDSANKKYDECPICKSQRFRRESQK